MYHLLIKFGKDVYPVSIPVLDELTISQDFNKLLPEFRLRVKDTDGSLTHLVPSDRNMRDVYIELASDDQNPDDKNVFEFESYRRMPEGDRPTPSTIYDIVGLLKSPKLFSPDYIRGFDGTISSTIQTLADEMELDSEISPSLSSVKNIIQPSWTNAQLLSYLQNQLIGDNEEYGYKAFVKTSKRKNILVFRSTYEMAQDKVSYKFSLRDTQYQDRYPILNYYIYDNGKIFGTFASKQQAYGYFDFETGAYVSTNESVASYFSLSDFFLIDKSDSTDSNSITNTGRTNDFNGSFAGKIKNSYGDRLLGLVKMWITTQGLQNAVPGNMVELFFPIDASNLHSHQYSGFWMVERVVHNVGNAFLTKLLLTRHGLDTNKLSSLLPATTRKKN